MAKALLKTNTLDASDEDDREMENMMWAIIVACCVQINCNALHAIDAMDSMGLTGLFSHRVRRNHRRPVRHGYENERLRATHVRPVLHAGDGREGRRQHHRHRGDRFLKRYAVHERLRRGQGRPEVPRAVDGAPALEGQRARCLCYN